MNKKIRLYIPIISWIGVLLIYQENSHAQTVFTDITEQAGISHQYKVYEGMFGGGACVLDFDKDGFDDVFLTSGMNEDVLYRNNGNGTFTDVYEGSGLEGTRDYVALGVVGADVNRDGWVDLFITTITTKDTAKQIPRASNLLFLNQGGGKFQEATKEYRLDKLVSFSTGANFGDINADGYPDLYVGNYFHEYEGGLDYISDATIVSAHQTAKGYLLMNKKGRRFSNEYEAYGLSHKGFGFGGLFTDFDNDGDQDLLVHHDFGYKRTPNLLLDNQYPKRNFIDVADSLEMDLRINSMGAAVGDINRDGYLDYFITNIRYNRFMVSQGPGKPYVEELKQRGLKSLAISWGANFVDFDHDGDLDLFVANGDLNPNCTAMFNFYFENEGGNFTELASRKGVNDYGIGRGSVVLDIENDGDMDILLINQEPVLPNYPVPSMTKLYRNDSTQGNWIKVSLQGTQSESQGLGSRVELCMGTRRIFQEIDGGGSSHLSQNARYAHFGLGEKQAVDSVVVHWTGGDKQVVVAPQINTHLHVTEPTLSATSSSNGIIWALIPIGIFIGGWLLMRRNLHRRKSA